MSSAALLESITAAMSELEPQHVLQLRSRVARLAAMIEREDPEFRRRHAAGVEASRGRVAAGAVIAQGQDRGQ